MNELLSRLTNAGVRLAFVVLIASLGAVPLWSQAPAPASAAANDASQQATPYILQVGDEISIKAFQLADVEETVRIRPDGKISALLLPDVPAAGSTPEQLSKFLTDRYAEYFQHPKISVIVRTFSNFKVFVGGEVQQPQTIPLSGKLTALSAVLQAGGFRNTARTDSVILLRNDGNDHTLARRLNLRDVVNHGTGDVVLQPFDVVYVPRSKIASVDKFVDQYIRQLIPGNLNAGFTYLQGNGGVVRVP